MLKGLKIDDYLLKSFPQEISGTKRINGSVTASKVLLNGLINDVNLTALVQHQLKKNKPLQVVRSLISAEGGITITGNLKVDGLYHGVALKDLDKLNSDLELVAGKMADLKLVAKQIYVALLSGYFNQQPTKNNLRIIYHHLIFFFQCYFSCKKKKGELSTGIN